MSLDTILTFVQLGSAILVTVTILLQQRGGGLGGAFGGSSVEFSTKRGIERSIFIATIVAAVLFIGSSIARLVLSS